MKINYTPQAIADLRRLRHFIEVKNPKAAKNIAQQLLISINRLKQFPELGLPVKQAPNPGKLRDLFANKYTIRYLINKENIYILRLWHDKEDHQ